MRAIIFRISRPCAPPAGSWPAPSTCQQIHLPRNPFSRATQLLDRAEWIAVPWTNSAGVRTPEKLVRGCSVFRRMQADTKQQQTIRRARTLRRDHRGLPAAVGMPAAKRAPSPAGVGLALPEPRLRDRELAPPATSDCRPPHEMADRNAAPADPLRKGPRQTHQQRRARIRTRSVSQRQRVAVCCSGVCSTPRRSSASKTCSILMYPNSIDG
jgi:hypothetical protein